MIHWVLHQHKALLQFARKTDVQKNCAQESGNHNSLACRHILIGGSEFFVGELLNHQEIDQQNLADHQKDKLPVHTGSRIFEVVNQYRCFIIEFLFDDLFFGIIILFVW